MKIIAISDTHNKHKELFHLQTEKADVIIHAGDATGMGTISEVGSFLEWFNSLKAELKIFVPGNHDILFEKDPHVAEAMLKSYPGITPLIDKSITFKGYKFYGMPWMPIFYDWAFMAKDNGPKMKAKVNAIPDDTDIVITHCPSFMIGDFTMRRARVGSQTLREKLEKVKPKLHVWGHIHYDAGLHALPWGGIGINAAVLDEQYSYNGKRAFSVRFEER